MGLHGYSCRDVGWPKPADPLTDSFAVTPAYTIRLVAALRTVGL